MKAVCRNIFKEYNIPCNVAKKRRKSEKLRAKTVSYQADEDHTIEHFSEDENLSDSYHLVQLRRSFEIPLKLVTTHRNGAKGYFNETAESRKSFENSHNSSLFQGAKQKNTLPLTEDDEEEEDMMPRPIIIKEEPSDEIHLSWHSSTVSSIATTASNVTERKSKLQATLDSSLRNAYLRKTLTSSSNSLNIPRTPKCSKKPSSRYPTLDISIIKKTSPRRSPRIASMKRSVKTPPACRKVLSTSWLSSDEKPFQQRSSVSGEKSFLCSSPKATQVIETPSSTPSPRKVPTRPTELDLMIELIERENVAKAAKVKKSPRKSLKRCLPGGYVEMFQRSLAKAKTKGKFLKHDKKHGLTIGQTLRVLKLECSYGVHVAKVQRVTGRDNKIFAIVLPPEIITHLKSGSKIEAFFDESTKPYSVPHMNGESIEFYIEPYKLLLL